MGNPLPLNLAQECRKAQKILTEFVDPSHGGLDRIIPLSVLKRAQGFAIFSVARLGFLVSARAGSGVVIARLDDGSWSSPSALGLGGLGGGFNAGLDVTDFLIVLNSKQAVRSFMATGSLQLGGNLSVAVGPLGRAAEASGTLNSSGNVAAMYSYSRSKGLYGGVSVEGTILVDRADANSKAYGRHVTAKQLLSGSVEPPVFAEPLITTIEKFTLTGRVGERIDAGRRDNDMDGWSIDEDYRSNADMDSLDREMQQARLSPSSPNRRAKGVEDYETQRPGDYAFGSKGGGSHTNSPTRLRKSFLGGTTSSPFTGTDYAQDGGSSNGNYESPYISGNKSRMPFRRNKSSGSGSLFGDEAAVRYSNASKTPAFPTSFERSDEEDEPARKITRTPSPSRDNPSLRDSWEEAEELRRKPHSSFARSNGNDLLDFELDRSAVTQRQAPRPREKDLIDFNDPTPSRFPINSAPRRGGSGLDDLDKELQARSSMSSNDSLPHGTAWNVDYAYNNGDTAPTRPKMHTRTSSKQKIMNRLRGNSQSSKNAFANIETWDQRFNSRQQDRTPSPNLMGSGTPKNGTPTGFRSSGTPTGRRSGGTPTGLRSSTTPTGHKSSTPTPSKSSVPAVGGYESTQVIANFDFEGQEIDDLSFKRGDVIHVLRRTANRDDWWLGQLGAKTGNFPANYTEDV